jgi:hypothetical protein
MSYVRGGRWAFLVLAVFAALVIGVALSLYAMSQSSLLMAEANNLPLDEKRVAAQQAVLQFQSDSLARIWTTIVQGIVAIVLAIGGYFTWRNLRITQQTLKATQDKLEVDREAQITNRFTQAIGQLGAELKDGKPNLEVRLGGIYALEKVAQDAPDNYHWTIMEILTAYVRQNARWGESSSADTLLSFSEASESKALPAQRHAKELPASLRTDLQACMTVIGRRTPSADPGGRTRLDLHESDLRGAELWRAYLKYADFSGAHLTKADFSAADLSGADFTNADLTGAIFWHANLRAAIFMNAELAGAQFGSAQLDGAALHGAHLVDAVVQQNQVYSADRHGDGAILPSDWPADWRERFQDFVE